MKWLVVGTGKISNFFVKSIQEMGHHEIVGVLSRDENRALNFIKNNSLNAEHLNYSSNLTSVDFDSVYIGIPNSLHKNEIIKFLKLNKKVLCEKPITLNAVEFKEVLETHSITKGFLMDGIWTRFQPLFHKLKAQIQYYGTPKKVTCYLGFKGGKKRVRLYDPALGPGSLLDMGIYGVSIFHYLFGKPINIHVSAKFEDQVDVKTDVKCHYSDFVASFHTSIEEKYSNEFSVDYEQFKLCVSDPWWHGKKMWKMDDKKKELIFEDESNTFLYQIREMENCVKKNLKSSVYYPLEESMENLKLLDAIQALAIAKG